MEIIGLSGYARSGKDAAAGALQSLGFCRLAFADNLRDFALTLDPIIVMRGSIMSNSGARLSTIIGEYGWDGYKETVWAEDIRRNLQILGTECGRRILGDNVWIDATLANLGVDGKYVVADVRFPNEADAIRKRGGIIARIIRNGVGPANDHYSEIAMDGYPFDVVIHNDSTLEEFEQTVRGFLGESWR